MAVAIEVVGRSLPVWGARTVRAGVRKHRDSIHVGRDVTEGNYIQLQLLQTHKHPLRWGSKDTSEVVGGKLCNTTYVSATSRPVQVTTLIIREPEGVPFTPTAPEDNRLKTEEIRAVA